MTVCENIVVDPASSEHSIERAFSRLRFGGFPAAAGPFCVFAMLTDAEGDTTLRLHVERQDDPYEVAQRVDLSVRFPDRLRVIKCVVRVARCVFPSPGTYLFTLYADDDWLAQAVIRVQL